MKPALNQVHNLDCIEGLAKLPEGSIDLAFADPPFNIGYDYDVYDDRRAGDEYLNWSKQWIQGVIRAIKPTGAFWLAIGDEYAAELKVLCTRELGLHCRSWVIWFYTFGVHCKYKFTRSHAHLFHFVKDVDAFTFNVADVRVPSARQLVYGDKRAVAEGRMPDDTWMTPAALPPETPMFDGFVLRPQDIPSRFPPNSDTWYFSRIAGTFGERRGWHGCQMPEQLLGRIIRACSNEGEIVLDPFGGSGTTLAVAKKLKRQFIGFELSKTYTENIRARLSNSDFGTALIGAENSAASAPMTANGRRVKELRNVCPRRTATRVCASPVIARTNATLGQVAVANGEWATAIAEAFIASHEGYSADRVVADPNLNSTFLSSCEQLAIPGKPADWNRLLLNLRKRGGLDAVQTTRKDRISAPERERYEFASEIAWKVIADQHDVSLDDILCDPDRAALFDRISRRIAPGHSSFEYRWAALSLRKLFAKGNEILSGVRGRLSRQSFSLNKRVAMPSAPAHYLVKVSERSLFVGWTSSLSECVFFEPQQIEAASEELQMPAFAMRDVRILFQEFDSRQPDGFRIARRWRLIEAHQPKGNVSKPDNAA